MFSTDVTAYDVTSSSSSAITWSHVATATTAAQQQAAAASSAGVPLLSIIISVAFMTEDIFILPLNSFALYNILRHRSLQTRVNTCMFGLLSADLLIGLLIPWHVSSFLIPSQNLVRYSCLVRIAITQAACLVSALSLLLVTFDRYVAIVHPYHYARNGAIPHLRIIIAGVWLYSLMFAIVIIAWSRWPAPCNPDTLISAAFYLPCGSCVIYAGSVAMVVMYARIFSVAAKQEERLLAEEQLRATLQRQSVHTVSLTVDSHSGKSDKQKKSAEGITVSRMKRERRYAKVMAMVVTAFFICWMPQIITTTLLMTNTVPSSVTMFYVRTFTGSIVTLGSLFNPIIYIWKTPEFKTRLYRLLPCLRSTAVAQEPISVTNVTTVLH